MLTTPTLDKLHDLGLMGMARAFQEQLERADYQTLTFEQRLGLLVDREAQDRQNRRLERNLKAAKLRFKFGVEDLDFARMRLDRAYILSLAESRWVDGHQQVLIVSATGVGKTYLSCALTHAAIRRGHTARYHRVPRLLGQLAIARADGRLPRMMTALAKVDLLLLDDLGLSPLTAEQAADLLELIEDRSQLRSTIVTSQLPVAHWHASLGEPTVADAIMDRLVHNAHRVELRGESLRRPRDDATQHSEGTQRAPQASEDSETPGSLENRSPEMAVEAR